MNLYQVYVSHRRLRINVPKYVFARTEEDAASTLPKDKVTSVKLLCDEQLIIRSQE